MSPTAPAPPPPAPPPPPAAPSPAPAAPAAEIPISRHPAAAAAAQGSWLPWRDWFCLLLPAVLWLVSLMPSLDYGGWVSLGPWQGWGSLKFAPFLFGLVAAIALTVGVRQKNSGDRLGAIVMGGCLLAYLGGSSGLRGTLLHRGGWSLQLYAIGFVLSIVGAVLLALGVPSGKTGLRVAALVLLSGAALFALIGVFGSSFSASVGFFLSLLLVLGGLAVAIVAMRAPGGGAAAASGGHAPGVAPAYQSAQNGHAQLNQQNETDGFAVAALVLGILGFSLFAIVFGAVALGRTGPGKKKGHGMAVAGLVLGILWVVAVIVFYIAIFAALN